MRTLRWGVGVTLAGALAGAILVGSVSSGSPRPSAEQLVRAALKPSLPDSQRVVCDSKEATAGRVCRWTAKRVLSPNRTHICRGRHVVSNAGRGASVRRLGRHRCRLRVAPVNPDFGFSDNSVRVGLVSLEDNVRLTEGLGAGLLRLDLDWRAVEPRRGEYHFEDYDRIYEAVLAAGIRPLLMIGYAPSWAWDPLSLCQGSCHYPPHPRWYGSWRQVVAAAVHRYPRAAGIEIWNEPNTLGFWHSGPDPVRYTQLLAEAHRAVKGVDPSFPVISGGLANGFHDAPSGRSMRGFLHDMYVAGAKGYLDGIGFHPYPGGNSFQWLEGSLEAVRAVRDAADPGRPLWATETGLSTTGTDPLLVVSEAEQAAALVRLVRLLRDQPDVKAVLIHSLIERPGAATDRETGFGVVRPDLRPKPAYCMLAAALGGKPCSG